MLFSALAVLATAASSAVAAGHGPGPGAVYEYPAPVGDGWEHASTSFYIDPASTRKRGYYAASQYFFKGHSVQYFGLQTYGPSDNRATTGQIAYSVFGNGSSIGDPERCSQGADHGAGTSCSLKIDIDSGRWYTINSDVVERKADGSRRWNGTLVDDTGKKTYIASFWTDATYQALKNVTNNWLEWFPYNIDHLEEPQRECQPWYKVHYSEPRLIDGNGVVTRSNKNYNLWTTATRKDDKCAVYANTPNWNVAFQPDKSFIITAGVLPNPPEK